jgi:hypothetical protein
MPGYLQSLQGSDLTFLHVVADLWGIELVASDARQGMTTLATRLQDPRLVEETIASLPAEARRALEYITRNEGRMPWAQFIRRFGEVREMGPGRRDRERPYENPISAAEMLWYRALVFRAFFDTPKGPEEFAYIPDELNGLLQVEGNHSAPVMGRQATVKERANPILANDRILDHACTLLAHLRAGLPGVQMIFPTEQAKELLPPYPVTFDALQALLAAAGLLGEDGLPKPEATRAFLEAPRGAALAQLVLAWLDSDFFNELRLTPTLQLEGEWANDPRKTRHTILNVLKSLPGEDWWSLEAIVSAVHRHDPDFQRLAGDYDSWFIRDKVTGAPLRGFEHWGEVEGALLRYLICGPLHWLGILDLALPVASSADSKPWATAFRFSRWSADLLRGRTPAGRPVEEATIQVTSVGKVRIPRLAPRVARYLIARFCDPISGEEDKYIYQVNPISLERARDQGLRAGHLWALFRRYAVKLPPNLAKALERWEEQGTQAHMERLLVLRVSSPKILEELRGSKAARFLGEPLGPTAVVVKPGAWKKVIAALAELGYLVSEIQDQ